MPLGTRQLFVYWRVATADVAPAVQALREWQSDLRITYPTLVIRNHRRADAARGDATVMESYALQTPHPSAGIDPALQRRIEDEGVAALRRWLRGTRHVEVFDAIDDVPGGAPPGG